MNGYDRGVMGIELIFNFLRRKPAVTHPQPSGCGLLPVRARFVWAVVWALVPVCGSALFPQAAMANSQSVQVARAGDDTRVAQVAAWFAPPPQIDARAAVVIEAATDQELYALNADQPWPPASLTKLVAMYVVFEAAAAGEFDLDGWYEVPEAAFHFNVPPGSSLMFLGPDQVVDGHTLLQGLGVASGNDAAVATGLLVAGSVDRFVGRMNNLAVRLGLTDTRFVEPSGLSAENVTTAREFGRFAAQFVRAWPHAPDRYLTVDPFAYPQARNVTVNRVVRPIVQGNRNLLLTQYPGADGLKTGFIDESRYNLAASAVREGRRLIVVLLGVEGENAIQGGRRRAEMAGALLDWAFTHTELVELGAPPLPSPRVWESRLRSARLIADSPPRITIPAGAESRLDGRLDLPVSLTAPVAAGTRVGSVRYTLDGAPVVEIPVRVGTTIEPAGLLRRLWHRILRFFTRA